MESRTRPTEKVLLFRPATPLGEQGRWLRPVLVVEWFKSLFNATQANRETTYRLLCKTTRMMLPVVKDPVVLAEPNLKIRFPTNPNTNVGWFFLGDGGDEVRHLCVTLRLNQLHFIGIFPYLLQI
ncbi:hypothetical protein NNA36_15975 [Shimia sp. CNT1-13L.2]|uniref:hypothetical protein n=1 Tax=Shimia sp. CNT1-13L.2 TaxID=2959663 RepID=UPI0020CC8F15|nr:hypothetical protein [Shimia sp. CNT1-13L.2]MCP9483464.1 hypothetical protein [Shimia sp. CNT1-13L.2]